MELGILFIFILSACILLFYWLKIFSKIYKVDQNQIDDSFRYPLSIIIAAKNEAGNIVNCLSSILNQDYPAFEIIVVDDHSKDKTKELISSLNSDKVKLFSSPNKCNGKKQAIAFGITNANYDHFVFTDADCVPSSINWLSVINSSFLKGNNIVLGYGRFNKSNSILNRMIRYESLLTVIHYYSFTLNNDPYMGVGRNLAYSRELYESSISTKNHEEILSGDDDLFVNQNSERLKAGILLSMKAQTFSEPEPTIKSYFYQKRRQLIAGNYYKPKHRLLLAIYGISQLLFTSTLIGLVLFSQQIILTFSIFGFVQLIQLYIFIRICKILGDKDLIYWKPFLEGLYIYIITIIGISTWVWKVDRWK